MKLSDKGWQVNQLERYESKWGRIRRFVGGTVYVSTSLLLIVTVVAALFASRDTLLGLVGCLPLVGLMGYLASFDLMNKYPVVWVHSKGLIISYHLTQRCEVSWEAIVDVNRPRWYESHRIGPDTIRIEAQTLPDWYRLYGYNLFRPGFFLPRDMANRTELLRIIDVHTGRYLRE